MSGATDPVGRGIGGDWGEISWRLGSAVAESIAKHRSPRSSWLYLKQLLEPRSPIVEALSSSHKPEKALILNMNTIVAIDVAKDSLEVRLTNDSLTLRNNSSGFEKLIARCRTLESPRVVFEATGGYEQALKRALHDANIELCLVTANLVRAFALSEGLKAKTDAIDAALILRFAQEKRLKPTPVPTVSQAKLTALLDRRNHLTEQLTREKTRRHKASDMIIPFVDEMIKHVEAQLQATVSLCNGYFRVF